MAAAHAFIDGLDPEDREALLALLNRQGFGPGKLVISHLDTSRDMFFLFEGRVKVTIFSEKGRVVDFREIPPGGFFGEIAAIDGGPRSASVIALDPIRGGWLRQRDFAQMLATRPGFAQALLTHLAGQVRRLTERVFEFSAHPMRYRLVLELIRLGEAAGTGDRVVFAPRPTDSDIAARISSHREAVNRQLNEFEAAGLLWKDGSTLEIYSLDRLRRWLED